MRANPKRPRALRAGVFTLIEKLGVLAIATRLAAAAAIGAASTGSALAVTYKWIDESGVTNYGAYAPPGAVAHELNIYSTRTSFPEGSSGAVRAVRDLEGAFQQRRTEQLEQESRQAGLAKEKEEARRKCDAARLLYSTLISGRRVLYREADGEHRPVYGTYHSSEIQRTAELIKAYC